jgi:hypothetical protein
LIFDAKTTRLKRVVCLPFHHCHRISINRSQRRHPSLF